jgi:diguanylate cyclase (GGDEF)-like protein
MRTERRLSDLLSEFARTLVTDFPIQSILDHLVVRIVELLPVGSAGVTLISPAGEPRHIAASDGSARRFVRLQTEMAEGPCMAAYTTGEPVAVPDLRDDDRFPNFARRGLQEGLRAVFSFPLSHEDYQLGALDLYRTTAGPMDADAMEAAQTLADVTTAYLLNAQTRTDLMEASQRAVHTSLHDTLTGLPNRTLLIQRLDHAMLRSRRSRNMLAVLFVDLDRFKTVNDCYGHQVGDELLSAVADRLTNLLRPGDTLARLSGDEYVILCEDLEVASQVEPIAVRVGAAFTEAFVLAHVEIHISASVGIAFAGFAEDMPEEVLQNADAAMYKAKGRGGAGHAVVDLREDRLLNHRARLNRDLRGALLRDELRLRYQPIVDTKSGQITGAETLLRWEHPGYGIVQPKILVPLAEQSGLINEIGHWSIEQTCQDRRRWLTHDHHGEFGINVNVSVHQLMASDFVRSVGEVLTDTNTDPKCMTLEVTESVLVADEERALSVIRGLKRLGVMVALDDFGTGQSSLSHLRRFPVDTVKIDRTFIADVQNNSASWMIVKAVVDLAHGLGMTVVAEGVETFQQRDEVVALDCDFSQGFFFSRPESAADLNALLADSDILPKPNLLLDSSAWPNPPDRLGRRDSSHLENVLRDSEASSGLRRWRREHL